jgi:hypothetical protein
LVKNEQKIKNKYQGTWIKKNKKDKAKGKGRMKERNNK